MTGLERGQANGNGRGKKKTITKTSTGMPERCGERGGRRCARKEHELYY